MSVSISENPFSRAFSRTQYLISICVCVLLKSPEVEVTDTPVPAQDYGLLGDRIGLAIF